MGHDSPVSRILLEPSTTRTAIVNTATAGGDLGGGVDALLASSLPAGPG